MAESPSRPDAPGAVPDDDPGRQQVVEDGGPSGGFTAAPAPWGTSPPWWSADARDGTGPQIIVTGTGPQPLAGGTGGHRLPAPANGTGGHPLPGGTGGHALPGGTGGHPLPNGTGPLALPDGSGPQGTRAPLGAATPGGAPPERERRQVSGLLLGAGIGAALVAVLMVGVLAFRPDDSAGKRAKNATAAAESTRRITAVPRAGGMVKDATAPAASAAYPFVMAAVETAGVAAAGNGMAVYTDRPAGRVSVLFVGGTRPAGDPGGFLRRLRPSTFLAGEEGNPGKNGGKAECGTFAVLAGTHTYCAWATRDSYGVVASDVPTRNPDFSLMDDVMRRIRKDVEKPAR
ncbi:hypothetical protein [Actinomadura opuntiae]|uniref:hypothetical protein n=1 Tax=Actinomadura sp. OS1-43 TaxID=604315 RepID=UPI00255B276F|nr:hypothetical protein [Actinomadura sp. OS1-43]MDL4819262.1 hypothetical protein [Actinomadura sp. OS1-43]